MKKTVPELNSKQMIKLKKEFKKISNAQKYLESEMNKVIENKKKIKKRIKKEKQILLLQYRIKRVRVKR